MVRLRNRRTDNAGIAQNKRIREGVCKKLLDPYFASPNPAVKSF